MKPVRGPVGSRTIHPNTPAICEIEDLTFFPCLPHKAFPSGGYISIRSQGSESLSPCTGSEWCSWCAGGAAHRSISRCCCGAGYQGSCRAQHQAESRRKQALDIGPGPHLWLRCCCCRLGGQQPLQMLPAGGPVLLSQRQKPEASPEVSIRLWDSICEYAQAVMIYSIFCQAREFQGCTSCADSTAATRLASRLSNGVNCRICQAQHFV